VCVCVGGGGYTRHVWRLELVSVLLVPTYAHKTPDSLHSQTESCIGAVRSHDGDYVVAASSSSALHLLRMFNCSSALHLLRI
jgi:hypothetical protein